MSFVRRLLKSSGFETTLWILSILTLWYSGGKPRKFFHATGRDLKAESISGIITNFAPRSGQAARPASVIKPRRSSLRQRSLFSSVHLPDLVRGPKRCSVTPSTFFTVESIQPKHNASSTASRYHKGILRRCLSSFHGNPALLFSRTVFMSHSRKPLRLVIQRIFFGIIHKVFSLTMPYSRQDCAYLPYLRHR